jgi:hypothetical protein
VTLTTPGCVLMASKYAWTIVSISSAEGHCDTTVLSALDNGRTDVMTGSFDTVMVTVALLVDVEAPSSMLQGSHAIGQQGQA